MTFTAINPCNFNHFPIFSKKTGVKHFITNRLGGVSTGPYFSLNLGLNQSDDPSNVVENRKRVSQAAGFELQNFVFAQQTHSRNVYRVNSVDMGRGALTRETAIPNTDGMITNISGICLVTLAADCVPMLFFDPIKKAVGVAHAGWKGTLIKTPEAVVSAMVLEFGSNPSDIIVGIGPSAGPCCYEVGGDVIAEVEKSFGKSSEILIPSETEGKMKFNMWEANTLALIEAGVNPNNIETLCICTLCQNELFFSARKGDLGRFAAGIMLKNSI
jgi:polyphenol oxidase